MLHPIYTFTKTEVVFPSKKFYSEIHPRAYLEEIDAQEAMKREIHQELESCPNYDKEEIDKSLEFSPDYFCFHISRDVQVSFQISKIELYDDYVKKLAERSLA